MKTIIFKDLDDKDILDIIDPGIPFIFIPNFRPHPHREWWTTDIKMDPKDKLENVEVRDFTVDLMTDKKTIEKVFQRGQFNQLTLFQFTKRVPQTLKVDELPPATMESILIQNGLVNRIWINYEFVELSSINNNYLEVIKEKYKSSIV
jgi:hypothetical protein